MGKLNVTISYPKSDEYEFETQLVRLNLDRERENSISIGRGFPITKPQKTLKKEFKDINGIFSSRFGRGLDDINPFADRYKCSCGFLTQRINHGMTCPVCGTEVKFVDDDFGYFAWVVLKDPYYIIHPNLYKLLQHFIGKDKLIDILKPIEEKNIDGHTIKRKPSENPTKKEKENPFIGLGMIDFKEQINDILSFFMTKNPNKKEAYDELIKNKDKMFIQSIPVYTLHLRPYQIVGNKLAYEKTNSLYTMMTKLAAEINNDELRVFKKKKTKNQLLFNLSNKYMELYKELEAILSGKKGNFRTVFGGRYNFSSRSVIVPNPSLRIDQVVMPYAAMVELLQQTIINILQKSYNITYDAAYGIWSKAQIVKDERVYQIIKGLIKDDPRGIPILINRNPTISYGGILQMFVVDVCDSYTLGLPLQILPLLAADFDGDVLNILYMINSSFIEAAYRIFNPRNAFYISRNDGKLNPQVLFNKDTLINANAILNLARPNYSPEQLAKIQRAKCS